MKKTLLIAVAIFLLAGCKDALVEEVKNTPVSVTQIDTTYGVLFDTVFRDAQWTSTVDENGKEFVTVTGWFDWQEGAGEQESSFSIARNDSGKWAPVSLIVGTEEVSSRFVVGISFLFVCNSYKETQIRNTVVQ